MLIFIFLADLLPSVLGFDVIVVKHVGRAVDRNTDLSQVSEDVFF